MVGRKWKVTAYGYRVSFEGDENVLKWIAVMVAQLTALYSLNRFIIWYMNYISKLF